MLIITDYNNTTFVVVYTNRMRLFILAIIVFFGSHLTVLAQCSSTIASFPYSEGFETSQGGWVNGGTINDWSWGAPVKSVINTAGQGNKCWITGGLTGNSYLPSDAGWLQSPCFDFSALQYPRVSFLVYWETEQQFDGASLQYSLNNGGTWTSVGQANETPNCVQSSNWYNTAAINYLSPLASTTQGWSGSSVPASGSCRTGGGSNGWVTAYHTIPALAGKPAVIFRFIFGAGTICNNYNGFAIDSFTVAEAPANSASFSYTCLDSINVSFKNTSALCPKSFAWDFGDLASGTSNSSTIANPSHQFSGPGSYNVTLTVGGTDNAPSTTNTTINIISVTASAVSQANCTTNLGGTAGSIVIGGGVPYNYNWNTVPAQTTAMATGLGAGIYTIVVSPTSGCASSDTTEIILDNNCPGVFFPTGFTPNEDGKNDSYGPVGGIGALQNYIFRVYNRWGQRVFESKNPFNKWNGKINGAVQGSGVFCWEAQYSFPGKNLEFHRGAVTIIR
jgi:gliding motility-associated-like protein